MNSSIYIIAEAGVNHNGSIELAKQLVDVAADAGADAVKFQTFKASNIISKNAPKANYQIKKTDPQESQLEMIQKLELTHEKHRIIIEYCKDRGIQFLSTPFDIESMDLLVNQFNLPTLKISSGDITNGPLLLNAARTKKKLIISTGMSSMNEIRKALQIISFGYLNPTKNPSCSSFNDLFSLEEKNILTENIVLLHCTTEYPTPIEHVNLRAMETMSKTFNLPVGLSDHTQGINTAIAAAALGAKVIEKHFTINRTLPGPDHQASLEPSELRSLVKAIREIESALGNPEKVPAPIEMENRVIARKSLVASREIKIGEIFTENNIAIKRPGNGVSPMEYWEWLGKKAEKNFNEDDLLI